MAMADNLGDTSSGRPILFPLLLLITNKLHVKQSILCYLIQGISLLSFLWFLSPRKKLFSLTNTGILIGFLMLPAMWSYSGSCLTESILFAVEILIVIFLYFLFFPKRPTSLVMAVVYSVAIALLATLLKPWIMLFVVGCSVLLAVIACFGKAFRHVRVPALILFIVTTGVFAFSYRYNMNKTASSANIVYLLANSDKVDRLKARLHEAKDATGEEARFISRMIDDIELLKAKYSSDPYLAPPEELKVLKINNLPYVDTVNKAFKIAYLQRAKDVFNLMGLSVERYVTDTHVGLTCLDICYGPFFKILKKNGVYFVIALTALTFIFWFIRKRRQTAPVFNRPLSATGKQLLIFVGVLLFASIFFALFLSISGGIELRRTVLPAILFQLLAVSILVIKRQELTVAKL
jgi:ABC-type multidrug transport system fused ATPase/permease subunit